MSKAKKLLSKAEKAVNKAKRTEYIGKAKSAKKILQQLTN